MSSIWKLRQVSVLAALSLGTLAGCGPNVASGPAPAQTDESRGAGTNSALGEKNAERPPASKDGTR